MPCCVGRATVGRQAHIDPTASRSHPKRTAGRRIDVAQLSRAEAPCTSLSAPRMTRFTRHRADRPYRRTARQIASACLPACAVRLSLDGAPDLPIPLDEWTADMGGRGVTLHRRPVRGSFGTAGRTPRRGHFGLTPAPFCCSVAPAIRTTCRPTRCSSEIAMSRSVRTISTGVSYRPPCGECPCSPQLSSRNCQQDASS